VKTYSNTALAAKFVKDSGDKTIAAIASDETANVFGLDIIEKSVNDVKTNTTRFAAFSRVENTPFCLTKRENENFILVFTVQNESGALASALNIIGAHNFNMRALRSRPMKNLKWNYYFYIEAEGNVNTQNGKELMQEFRTATKPFKNNPTHITDVKKVLQQEFVKNGGVKVTYKNGARMPLDKYFAMATRTARNETQNATAIDNAIKLGTDYVYMAPNHSSCKTCSAMGNRVYCISGKDPSYPSVYGVLFKHGYNCIHPHCKCILRPYFIENHTSDEINKIKESSNRSFDLDERTEQQRQRYQESQAWNHRVWDSQKKFTEAKQTLGDKLPSQLNTKSKFQTAHAKQTPRYKETMQKVRFIERQKDIEAQLTKITKDGKIPIVGTSINAKQDTIHLVERLTERRISNNTFIDSIKSKPLQVGDVKYDEQNRPSHKIVYDKVTLYVNPENGNITTIHRTHSRIANKLKEGKNNGNSNK
ncbi:MAG: phage minor capsid protein, partial [Christensenellales bacterium]